MSRGIGYLEVILFMTHTSELSPPHRKAVKTIARVHVGGNKETEKLDTLRGDIAIQREDIGACRELEGAHFQLLHQHRFSYAVGAPAAIGSGLFGRHAQNRPIAELGMMSIDHRDGVWHQRMCRRQVKNGGLVLFRLFSKSLFQPLLVLQPVHIPDV